MYRRMGTYNPYFECYDVTRDDVLRLLARGWRACGNLQEVVDLSHRVLTPDGKVACISEFPDTPVGIWFNKEDAELILVC